MMNRQGLPLFGSDDFLRFQILISWALSLPNYNAYILNNIGVPKTTQQQSGFVLFNAVGKQ